MNYDEIVKALKEERRLNEELGKIIEEPSYYDPTHYEDEEGNINSQMIDHSKLVPLMVKTIQELEARIATLESK